MKQQSNLPKYLHLLNMRKRIIFYVSLLCLLSAFQCDDDFKLDEEVENLGLIEIEDTKRTFLVGESIFISTTINNQQTTVDGKTINLKDYLFDDETSLNHSLSLFKMGLNNEETPYFIQNAQEIEGGIFYNNEYPSFSITSPFDETNATFSSEIGVKLLEPGNYVLKPVSIQNSVYRISFNIQSSLGTLRMITSIENADQEGVYTFTVE